MAAQLHADIATLSFEKALAELEGIVRQLESGEVELERSIEIYERGAALRAHCDSKLKSAELKVERIVRGEDGQLTTEPASSDGDSSVRAASASLVPRIPLSPQPSARSCRPSPFPKGASRRSGYGSISGRKSGRRSPRLRSRRITRLTR